jgi:ABC-2 type transport system permease protein
MQPFTRNDAWPLLPTVLTVAALTGAAVALASRRDVGGGILASNDVVEPRPFGLRSSFGLAARLELPVLVAWCVGAVASAAVLGVIADLTKSIPPESVSNLLEKFGMDSGAFSARYLGVAFLLVAAVVALLPAGQLGAAADEELSGRLVHVLTRPPGRRAWLVGRLLLAAGAVAVAGLLAGLAAWAGAASQGLHFSVASLVGTGLNTVPTALLALGIGAVVFAFAPRFAGPTVYVVVAWSLVVDILASMVTSLHWLDRLGLFHYLALAPAESVDATTVVALCAVALALAVVAVEVFARRDVSSG